MHCIREKLNVAQEFIFRTAGFVIQMMITRNRAAEGLKYITDMAKRHPPDSEYEAAIITQIKGWCYDALGLTLLAEKSYKSMVKTLGRDTTNIGLLARFDMVNFYVKQHRFKEAAIYLHDLNPASVEIAAKLALLKFKIDSAAGKFHAAIDHYQRYKTINDSIFSSAKTRQIQQLQVEYETEKKGQGYQIAQKR